jgi:hypothetical protein
VQSSSPRRPEIPCLKKPIKVTTKSNFNLLNDAADHCISGIFFEPDGKVKGKSSLSVPKEERNAGKKHSPACKTRHQRGKAGAEGEQFAKKQTPATSFSLCDWNKSACSSKYSYI